ncbi:hypothetical protein CBR_g51970 [Chara braunii]|uniref:Uncharacterized protein n=1 Tax=Chara braunii TaxID=69332 RepID=A0A388K6J1_CHABU|nr:hypothetical protein CBR_g51970 [Chara braunii]|eukprot:GBG65670.1 hypothetical protein CBR_g51970 [Chara braunii]
MEEESNKSEHDIDMQDIIAVGGGGFGIGEDSDEGVCEQPNSGQGMVAIGGLGALSLRLKSRGEDGPTIAGGWLKLEKDWVDEDLEGDTTNVTYVGDDDEVGGTATRSPTGNTNVALAPSTTMSASMQRLGEVEEVAEGDEVEDVADAEDESDEDEDDVPGDEWVDKRSDSERS